MSGQNRHVKIYKIDFTDIVVEGMVEKRFDLVCRRMFVSQLGVPEKYTLQIQTITTIEINSFF